MAPQVLSRTQRGKERRRKAVVAGDGSYFAGEATRILRLRHLDYDQLHRLFEIVRGEARLPNERDTWRRFTFTDLASLKVAAELIGAGSRKTQRLRIKQLAEVCQHLRNEFGLEHPLIHAKLRALGSTILVQLEGKHFSATTTQRVFDEIAQDIATYEQAPAAAVQRRRISAQRSAAKSRAESGVFEAPVLKVGKV